VQTIYCFYTSNYADRNYSLLNQVKYTYNPAESANFINADLASLLFSGGVQLTLAGNAISSTCNTSTTTASTSGTTCGNTSSTTASASNQPSLQQDIESLTQGGNFLLRADWPWLNYMNGPIQAIAMANARIGATVSGLGQNTPAGASSANEYYSNEAFLQVDALPQHQGDAESAGAVYVDYRVGIDHIPQTFAENAGLQGNSFLLQQIDIGLVFSGKLRIAAERYFGPEQIYTTTANQPVKTNNFSTWQLSIQLAPPSTAKSKSKQNNGNQ